MHMPGGGSGRGQSRGSIRSQGWCAPRIWPPSSLMRSGHAGGRARPTGMPVQRAPPSSSMLTATHRPRTQFAPAPRGTGVADRLVTPSCNTRSGPGRRGARGRVASSRSSSDAGADDAGGTRACSAAGRSIRCEPRCCETDSRTSASSCARLGRPSAWAALPVLSDQQRIAQLQVQIERRRWWPIRSIQLAGDLHALVVARLLGQQGSSPAISSASTACNQRRFSVRRAMRPEAEGQAVVGQHGHHEAESGQPGRDARSWRPECRQFGRHPGIEQDSAGGKGPGAPGSSGAASAVTRKGRPGMTQRPASTSSRRASAGSRRRRRYPGHRPDATSRHQASSRGHAAQQQGRGHWRHRRPRARREATGHRRFGPARPAGRHGGQRSSMAQTTSAARRSTTPGSARRASRWSSANCRGSRITPPPRQTSPSLDHGALAGRDGPLRLEEAQRQLASRIAQRTSRVGLAGSGSWRRPASAAAASRRSAQVNRPPGRELSSSGWSWPLTTISVLVSPGRDEPGSCSPPPRGPLFLPDRRCPGPGAGPV